MTEPGPPAEAADHQEPAGHRQRLRCPAARRAAVQRDLAADGTGEPQPGRRRPHDPHGARLPLPLGPGARARPRQPARGEWQISRVYTVLGRAEPALHHARRVLDICQENGIGDWDLAFAYEALARAHAVAGDAAQAREYTDQALAAAEDIAEDEERELVMADLETIPGQPRYW